MNMWQALQKKTKRIFFLTVALNVLALFAGAGALYLLDVKRSTVMALAEELHSKTGNIEKIHSGKRLVADTKEDRAHLDALFVDAGSIVSFIERIESLGAHSGITLEMRSVDIGTGEDGELLLRFMTKGSWSSTMYFLTLLESLPARLLVEENTLRKVEGIEKNKAKVFWQGDFTIALKSFLSK